MIMKKILLILSILLALPFAAKAQYEPTTTWPYMYRDFTKGTLLTPDGAKKEALFNIHFAYSTVQFIEGDLIKELSGTDVFSLQIGSDVYVKADGKMMKVLAKNDNGFVVKGYEIDFAKLNSAGAAYGSGSTTLGNVSMSSLEGIGGSRSNMNHMELKSNKDAGDVLPLIEKTYLMCGGEVIFATRRDVSEAVGEAVLKPFLKTNKIKWNDPASLLAVVDLIANNKQ